MSTRFEALGINAPDQLNAKGFPSRYDYRVEPITIAFLGGTLNTGRFEILSYPQNANRVIVGFGDSLNWSSGDKSFVINASLKRASLRFSENQTPISWTFEAQNGNFVVDGLSVEFSHFVIAYDQSHDPEFAARFVALDGKTQTLEDKSFDELWTRFQLIGREKTTAN